MKFCHQKNVMFFESTNDIMNNFEKTAMAKVRQILNSIHTSRTTKVTFVRTCPGPDVGGQHCPDSVRIYCAVPVGQNLVQIRNPDTRKPSRPKISDFDGQTPYSKPGQNPDRAAPDRTDYCDVITCVKTLFRKYIDPATSFYWDSLRLSPSGCFAIGASSPQEKFKCRSLSRIPRAISQFSW